MKDAVSLVLAFLIACSGANSSSKTPRRSSWNQPLQSQQNRVQAHSGLTVVNPPQLSPSERFSRRGGPLPGYLPLRPVPTLRHPRWFGAETAPKPSFLRPPPSYERYPPFWSDESNRSGQPRNRHSQPQHRHPKKACNPCNSVPWIPIFKSPAGISGNHHPRQLVPEIEVYPESSIQQHSIILPQSLIPAEAPPVIIQQSHGLVGLPIGNIPVAPSLLLSPEQHLTIPELSPHPIAPIHEAVPFITENQHSTIQESPKVVVTIQEPEPPQDVHLVAQDQHSEPSSFVDSHSSQNYNNYGSHGSVDIVKSIPLAEYTSSIEHPFHLIQSPPYVDINPQPAPSPTPFTYEKPPKTGIQKVSDFILAVSKEQELKKNGIHDSTPEGSAKIAAHSVSKVSTPPPDLFSTPKLKATRLEEAPKESLDPNILTPPPLPPHLTQLLPTYDTAYLHPLFPVEHRGVASAVNGALLPPPIPQPMNPTTIQPTQTTLPPKKIQIIIPYTTVYNQEYDQNAVGSGNRPVNKSFTEPQKLQTWSPIVVTESPQNQPRKIPQTQMFQNFKNFNWSENQSPQSSQVQHILASNIRDLLQKEMEPKQNIRLQKNIDNWTALEYSNHKIVGKKQPSDIISHAQAVTSIPGTSISHLLLPSKKIPDGYFTSTIGPYYDEPSTTSFPASSVSVNSKPFTTLSRYSSVVWTGPSSRTTEGFRSTTPATEADNEIYEETTPQWSSLKVSIAPGTNEKVYVVTPVSNWATSRRSTRHVDVTEKYIPQESQNAIFTKLEKVQNVNKTETNERSKLKLSEKTFYPKSTPLFRIKANQTRYEKISKFTKPKPIAKFFATTAISQVQNSTSVKPITRSTEPTTTTLATFPFRNGGELPLEMSKVNFSSSQLMFKNTGERKTLIKQVKTNNRQGKEETPVTTKKSLVTLKKETVTTTELPSPSLEVDVVFPFKSNSVKKGDPKKPTNYDKKKMPEKVGVKNDNKSIINPDEPNITEDDREDINSLMKNGAVNSDKDTKETLLAVETALPSMSGGVFGQTRPHNSSRSLLDTIKLLREFLADTSEEQSQEKTQKIEKVIEKIESKGKEGKKQQKDVYRYNFPEYLMEELHLNKDEMGLVEDAMVELRKNKERKKVEPST